jgi:hypothetical protein
VWVWADELVLPSRTSANIFKDIRKHPCAAGTWREA